MTSYNKIASSYDFLSRLVFGKSQVQAQNQQLHYIINCTSILIVGGGTGWILEEISKVNPTTQVTYLEYSTAMLELAKEVNYKNPMHFMQGDAETFKSERGFDAVLTPFLFDNFDERKAVVVFENLHSLLHRDGLWLYVDFQPDGKFWKRVLLKSMQIFFRTIGAIKTKQFVEMNSYFLDKGYRVVEEKLYYGEFIAARVFKK